MYIRKTIHIAVFPYIKQYIGKQKRNENTQSYTKQRIKHKNTEIQIHKQNKKKKLRKNLPMHTQGTKHTTTIQITFECTQGGKGKEKGIN